jgi:gentisate 1,2-dioxygenase
MSNVARLPNRDAALKALYEELAEKNMFPFWAQSSDVTNDEIKQLMGTKRAVPHVWRCADDIDQSCTAPSNWLRWRTPNAARWC